MIDSKPILTIKSCIGTPRLTGVYYNGPKGIQSLFGRDLWAGCPRTAARWNKNERLPKSDDFRRTTVGTTHIIQSGHIMARWKGKSLDFIGKLVSDLF